MEGSIFLCIIFYIYKKTKSLILSSGVGGARDGVGSVRTRKEPGEAGGASHAVDFAGYLVGAVDGGQRSIIFGFGKLVVKYVFKTSVEVGRYILAPCIRIAVGLVASKIIIFLDKRRRSSH